MFQTLSCSLFQEPGEGKINKDLPSCWECPKCYQGKGSASEVPNTFLLSLTCPVVLCLSLSRTLFLPSAKFRCFVTSTSFHTVDFDAQINNDTLCSSTTPTISSLPSHTSLPATRKAESRRARPPCRNPNSHTRKAKE